jgi:hypothetical protein
VDAEMVAVVSRMRRTGRLHAKLEVECERVEARYREAWSRCEGYASGDLSLGWRQLEGYGKALCFYGQVCLDLSDLIRRLEMACAEEVDRG